MKLCFANGSCSRTPIAAAALLAGMSLALVSGGATARQYPYYAPHPKLTPYQIVADDGSCLQADSPTPTLISPTLTSAPTLAQCSDSSATQKFYVLQRQGLSDFAPQVNAAQPGVGDTGSNARIVLAADLDGSPLGGYSYLFLNSTQGVQSNVAALLNVAKLANLDFTWRISKTSAAQQWAYVQDESGTVTLAGPGTRVMRFGVDGNWSPAQAFEFSPVGQISSVTCDITTFGGVDPIPGTEKHCEMLISPPDDTPLKLSIQAGDKCMARVDGAVSTVACSSVPPVAIPSNALWSLRPTQYLSTPAN